MVDRVHIHANLIFSAGTQVVTLRDVTGDGGRILHPRGAVGVVIKSPRDHEHSYRVRFADGVEASLKRQDVVMLAQYKEGKIPVGQFNMQAFAMVKSDRRTLLDFMKDKVEIRAGFNELLSYCQQQGFRFVIVSNGLNFYIEDILKGMGITNIKVFAAQTRFDPKGVEVKYIGPDGDELQDNFKVAYTRLFLNMGYQVIYLGNGISDLSPASQSHHVFATGELSDACKQANVNCTVFTDLNEVVRRLELL